LQFQFGGGALATPMSEQPLGTLARKRPSSETLPLCEKAAERRMRQEQQHTPTNLPSTGVVSYVQTLKCEIVCVMDAFDQRYSVAVACRLATAVHTTEFDCQHINRKESPAL